MCVQDFAPVTVTFKTWCCSSAVGMSCCASRPSPFLQLCSPGVPSQTRGFLEYSFLPVLPGDVPLSLQTRLQFHFLQETSPDLAGQSPVPPSVRACKALRTWRGCPRVPERLASREPAWRYSDIFARSSSSPREGVTGKWMVTPVTWVLVSPVLLV